MTAGGNQQTSGLQSEIGTYFAERLVPVAFRGLQIMFRPQEGVFCTTAILSEDGRVVPTGSSNRYTAMVLIGLAMQERLGRQPAFPLGTAWQRVTAWALSEASLGDAGLVLWGLSIRQSEDAGKVAEAIRRRQDQIGDPRVGCDSMSTGWLLAGLCQAAALGLCGNEVQDLARKACQALLHNFRNETGLFSFGTSVSRKNLWAARFNSRLGSFASQVYPIIGLSLYGMVTGEAEPVQKALRCADTVCRLQGPHGQWWWIYNTHSGEVALRYPVYSVHQDAMGPMALLALSRACGERRYDRAILDSLLWMDRHPEQPEARLIDESQGVILRAVQRDSRRAIGRLGLGTTERLRLYLTSWLGFPDRRPFRDGYVCDECRPYHLGWILLAAAMNETRL